MRMLCKLRCVQAGGGGHNVWYYDSADALSAVRASGYFNDAANMLNVRDLIIVQDTNAPTTNFVTVLSNTGTVVDVSNGTAIVETDGD